MSNQIKNISFLKSSATYKDCPSGDKNEYAFVGRSNVGKSSLINMLANNRKLAKTSGTPGKTQLINHFIVDDLWYLVDLPGYGWAKTSKTLRGVFQAMVTEYLLKRENLINVFALIDCRIPPQDIDLKFMNFLIEKEIPFSIVFTKADKLGSSALLSNIESYKNILLESWQELPLVFVSSSSKTTGKDEILDYIAALNKEIRIK